MKALELQSVTASYSPSSVGSKQRRVLHGVSLCVTPGTVTAILGPNGAGKTTLLNVALGWHQPDSGTVVVDGKPIGEVSAAERGRLLSLVPQQDHIPFEYSILEYVLLGRAPYIGRLERPSSRDLIAARAALEQAGLTGRETEGVLETSAGERELVLLARSLAQEPAYMLLDEPSAHLDLANKRRIAGLIRRQAEMGRGVLLTVHEPEFAAEIADSVILLRDGQVLAEGSPDTTITGELLSSTYGVRVDVVHTAGRMVVLW